MAYFGNHKGFYLVKSQRLGVVALIVLIVILQLLIFTVESFGLKSSALKLQENEVVLLKLDSLCLAMERRQLERRYSYNPNFIDDERGYRLGMKLEEIDRLLFFRGEGKFVNSAEEFQKITGVSDEWLATHSVDFKFPDWVNQSQNSLKYFQNSKGASSEKSVVVVRDINEATAEELMVVRGIGPVLSERIVMERDKFGGFVSMEQIDFIWGISPEVVVEIKRYFNVLSPISPTRIAINDAGREELKEVPYLNYYLGMEIIKHRSRNGDLKSIDDLREIKNIPLDKLHIINLYLAF